MSTVEIETGNIIKRYAFWNPATWSIPKLYWDAWSIEQRTHAICRQLEKVIAYADYVGVNVDDIAARLKAIEEGQLDPVIEAAIEAWFEENEPSIIARLNAIEADDWVTTNRIADGAVTTDKIADFAITRDKLAQYAVIQPDNPIYYGADPTGTEDSTQAIQDAIDANQGGAIVFSPGVYLVSGTLELPFDMDKKTSINGNHAILTWTGTIVNGIYVGADRTDIDPNYAGVGRTCFIQNLFLDFENANCTRAIDIENGCKDVIIQNVKIYRALNGVRIGNPDNTIYPSDTKIINCMIYGKGSEYDGCGVISICTDNNVQLTRIYGFRKGIFCKGTIDIDSTQVLLRWAESDTIWNPYDFNSQEFDDYYRTTCFAEIQGPTRIVNSYADSTYMFVDYKTGGNVIVTNSFYYNSRFASVDCKVFNIDNSTPNIKITNNEIQMCSNALQQSYGVFFAKAPTIGYTQMDVSNNIVTAVSYLLPYDLLKCNYGGEANASDNAVNNTWYVFGCIPLVNGAGGANEKIITVKAPNGLVQLYTFFNAGGTSGTLKAKIISSNGTTVTDYGLVPLTANNQTYWLLCYKPVTGAKSAHIIDVQASSESLWNMFSSGRPAGTHPSEGLPQPPSTPTITATAS